MSTHLRLIQQHGDGVGGRTSSEPDRPGLGCRFACLTYHVIGKDGSQYTLDEAQFEAQLAFLEGEGYVVDDFEQLEARLRSKQGIPNRYVVLTIDDGHESSMRAADMLQTYGCRATFFLTRDRCLRKSHFIRDSQIRELRKAGFSMGTHGTTHRKLTFIPPAACVVELNESKQWLADLLGEAVRYMAAPGGYINDRVLRLACRSGYTLIATCRERMNLLERTCLPGTVNRVSVRQHFSLQEFRYAIGGRTAFYLMRQIRAATLALPKQLLR